MKNHIGALCVALFTVSGVAEAAGTLGDWTGGLTDPKEWGKDYLEDQFRDAVFGPEISEGMNAIFGGVQRAYNGERNRRRRRCDSAAFIKADWVVSELRTNYVVGGFGRIAYDIEKKLLTLGTSSLADAFRSMTEDALRSFIRDQFKDEKVEIYQSTFDAGSCPRVVKAIWDKSNGRYQVFISGNCSCQKVTAKYFTRRKIRLKEWVTLHTGTIQLVPNRRRDGLTYRVSTPQIKIAANCACNSPQGLQNRPFTLPGSTSVVTPPPPTTPSSGCEDPEPRPTPPPQEDPIPEPEPEPQTPCTDCTDLAERLQETVQALREQQAACTQIRTALLNIDNQLDETAQALAAVRSGLAEREGEGATSTDPTTGIVISSVDAGDGRIRITTTYPDGRIHVRHRERRSKRDLREEERRLQEQNEQLEAQRAELRADLLACEAEVAALRSLADEWVVSLTQCSEESCPGAFGLCGEGQMARALPFEIDPTRLESVNPEFLFERATLVKVQEVQDESEESAHYRFDH